MSGCGRSGADASTFGSGCGRVDRRLNHRKRGAMSIITIVIIVVVVLLVLGFFGRGRL